MFRRIFAIGLFLVACSSLWADVTMRMALDLKVNMAVPTAIPELPVKELLTRVKGDRGSAVFGNIVSITDNSRSDVTLIDTKAQHFAIISMADYLAKLQAKNMAGADKADAAQADAVKQMLANIKMDVQSRDTGRSDRIGGIDVTEREVVVNMSIPVPVPGQENGLQMTMKFQLWKPKASELDRVPALRELANYNDRNQGFNNPTTLLRQMFSAMPGMSDSAAKMADEMKKGGSVTLGLHMGVFMPGLGKMMEQARAAGKTVPDMPSADTPLAEFSLNLKELSTDTVPASAFTVPAGYTEAPSDELIKGMMESFVPAK